MVDKNQALVGSSGSILVQAKFTVDTHLFRELGELLVGRDSTALVELIKNAYDADATKVVVDGQLLSDPDNGRITIADDGTGMNASQFERGFLRIASRYKEEGNRRSPRFHRRYTGAKGIGRLAAHKLASFLHIYSVPLPGTAESDIRAIDASIDWQTIESLATLDDLEHSNAILLKAEERSPTAQSGTIIELRRLRRQWSPVERARFFAEVQTFSAPAMIVNLPPSLTKFPLLFDRPKVSERKRTDPGFDVQLTGELESGEDYWQALAQAAQWIIEIDAKQSDKKIYYNIVPTQSGQRQFPDAVPQSYTMEHPVPDVGPFFQARILIREGVTESRAERAWQGRSSGIRVYMEGFRVLPYGEPEDDWLAIDADYATRPKTLNFLSNLDFAGDPTDKQEGLVFLKKNAYFGAVFLTAAGAPTLRMLINREGFIPDAGYTNLVQILRTGVYLSVRVRAAAKAISRAERSGKRRLHAAASVEPSRLNLRQAVEVSVKRASDLATEARQLASVGDYKAAEMRIREAADQFSLSSSTSERLMTEGGILRVLASVGAQMAAFVHEINGILGSATALEAAVTRLREDDQLPVSARRKLGQLQGAIGDLRRSVERQASYLTDVISADARRRRMRQKLAERFDAAKRLVDPIAERRGISIINDIPPELKSPPMFLSEVTLVFSNLLTNAIKAAGPKGQIRGHGGDDNDGATVLRIENTGVAVRPEEGEKWFRPFESTTVETDPVLGQGMGMGLTITRNMLEEYGASINFARPSRGYATCIEIRFVK